MLYQWKDVEALVRVKEPKCSRRCRLGDGSSIIIKTVVLRSRAQGGDEQPVLGPRVAFVHHHDQRQICVFALCTLFPLRYSTSRTRIFPVPSIYPFYPIVLSLFYTVDRCTIREVFLYFLS